MEEQTFKTVLRNERRDKGVVLWDRNASGLGILPSQCSRALETFSSDTPDSPFSKVTYREDGEVQLEETSRGMRIRSGPGNSFSRFSTAMGMTARSFTMVTATPSSAKRWN